MSVCVVIRKEEEALQLKELGLRISGALGESLEFWAAEAEKSSEEKWHALLSGVGVKSVRVLSGANRKRQVLDAAKFESPKLLLVGKRAEEKVGDLDLQFSADVFDQVSCQVMVIRLCDELPPADARILVPCAGGRHSRRALKLAHAMTNNGTVAFQLRPDADDLSEEVGHRHLATLIKKAGLATDDVLTRVSLGEDFKEALVEEARQEDYGMLLIGASDSGTLRRKLFGTLPDRLMSRDGMTLGVIRSERSKGHRIREAFGRLIQTNIPQLNRNERLNLFSEVEAKSRWNFDFAALMSMATAIAGLGLLVNSGAVVIGAMLVAPLMMPLIGSGLALVQGNWPLCRSALGALVRGFCFALFIGIGMGLVARFLELGVTEQLLMRGAPNSLDLGIAFISGIAASFCIARPKLSGALAGVAIAAALVPPIATVGICLALGETEIAMGAGLLFGTNVVAIILGAGLNFALAGIRGKHKKGEWGRRGLIALLVICLGLAVPLTSGLLSRLSKNTDLEEEISASLPGNVHLVSVNRASGGGFEITVESSSPLEKEILPLLKEIISKRENQKTRVRLRTHLVIE